MDENIKQDSVIIRIVAMVCAVCLSVGVGVGYYLSKKNYNENHKQKDSDYLYYESLKESIQVENDTTETEAPEATESVETTEKAETESTEPQMSETLEPGRVTSIELDRYSLDLEIGEREMPMVTMYPEDAVNKGEIWTSSDEGVATVDRYGNVTGRGGGECTVTVTSVDNPAVSAEVSVKVKADETTAETAAETTQTKEEETKDLTYIAGILVVNKTYSLPPDYNPGVNGEAYSAFLKMQAAAQQEGIMLNIRSGFRDYYSQRAIYQSYYNKDGVGADRYSARAGHSEHQTGLAFDLNSLEQSFGSTAEGIWLKNNCAKYGFIIRYPEGKENITGYMYEPWHVRYLGVDVATKVYESGKCLEEYLGITSTYAD